MKTEDNIAVAVSGGVDSLYALSVMASAGTRILALYGRFRDIDTKDDPVALLTENCDRLGVSLYVADLREAFAESVMRPFAASYAAGLTPNPCALCNARIKFGLLLDYARSLGCSRLVTGHYVRKMLHPVYGSVLGAAADIRKDQSYFLALVPAERLMQAEFPLADITKDKARHAVEEQGLTIPIPRESQEICFIPDNDYRLFLQNMGVELSGPGSVLLTGDNSRVIGRHEGLWRYTEGQRRCLGIAWSEPLYVIGKDAAQNTLLVGPAGALCRRECVAAEANILVSPELWPEQLFVRIRYRQRAVRASVDMAYAAEQPALRIRFAEAQSMAAPGQIAAVYDAGGILLAGGIIAAEQSVT